MPDLLTTPPGLFRAAISPVPPVKWALGIGGIVPFVQDRFSDRGLRNRHHVGADGGSFDLCPPNSFTLCESPYHSFGVHMVLPHAFHGHGRMPIFVGVLWKAIGSQATLPDTLQTGKLSQVTGTTVRVEALSGFFIAIREVPAIRTSFGSCAPSVLR